MKKRFFNEPEPTTPKSPPEHAVINRLRLDTSINTDLLEVVKLGPAEREDKEKYIEDYNRRMSK